MAGPDPISSNMSTFLSHHPNADPKPCSVYALQVQVGDILKYGNTVNDGCRVTYVCCDDREGYTVAGNNDSDNRGENGGNVHGEVREGNTNDSGERKEEELQPVRLNGTVRIQWEDKKDGKRKFQLFEGMERLEVLRGDNKEEGRETQNDGSRQ